MFRMRTKPAPDFTPEQCATLAKAAGVVVACDADSRETLSPGRATRPLDGPEHPSDAERPSTAVVTAQAPAPA